MIKLTRPSGNAIYINPDHLVDIGSLKEGVTFVSTTISGDGFYEVTESPEEVARKVLEYKLYLIQHQVYIGNEESYPAAHGARKGLRKLAGLEESQ